MPLRKLRFDGKEYFTMLDYDEINALLKLANTDYGPNSCFDYIEGIGKLVDGPYCVGIFVEPVGALGFWGNDLIKLLQFCRELFLNQPKEMDYVTAGWTLFFFSQNQGEEIYEGINADKHSIKEIWDSAAKYGIEDLEDNASASN